MDDNTSPVADSDTTAPDEILAVLSDTEDTPASEPENVEETPQDESPEDEQVSDDETESEVKPNPDEPTDSEDEEVDPKEEARRRYEERQRVREETRQRVQQQTQEYIKDADNEVEERVRAIEANDYLRTVESNQNTLISEFERAKANPDLQIFNPENKEVFNEKLYSKAIRDYNAGQLQYDSYGNISEVKGSLYEHLTEMADLYGDAVKNGQVQQVRATRQMRNNADTKPAAPPKQTERDPVMEILTSD